MHRELQINDVIGEYRVTGFLGRGGMGVVYRGVHEKLGRPAAIKILQTSQDDPTFKTRFCNEARLQAALHHPNIATLYDFRDEGDRLVIFMELVDGECLGDLITRRAFTVEESLGVFASVCEAISYVHRNGVIHRDIKAENAKLTSSGSVKLLDFGIAKDSVSHGLTQTGGVIGTPNYLSPEQFEGAGASVQTDVWALGILLYQMMTGSLPFEGDTLGGLVLKIAKAEFPAPEKLNPAVPRDVSAIICKCLKRNPNERYKTVDDLLEAVRRVQNSRQPRGATVFGIASRAAVPEDGVKSTEVESFAEPVSEKAPVRSFPAALVAAIGAAAVLLVVIAGAAVYMMLSSSGSTTNAKAASGPSSGDARAATRIRVDVDEGRAQVLRNGQVLGTTPIDIDASLGERLPLTLRREGFEDKQVEIEATTGKKVFTFSLKRK
jgi:eukaryotic-like serine/threonine-protein kinase